MNITIDVESDIAIFTQLVEQIKQGVATELMLPGMPLPAIRKVAQELGINPNTVSKAYKLLERDKIIVTKGYKGTFINENAKDYCGVDLNTKAQELMSNQVSQMRELGLTDSEIRIAFSAAMKTV